MVQLGVQLAMYATPVIYPLSKIPVKYRWIALANPMTALIETFKYGLLGQGTFSWSSLAYSAVFTLVEVLLGTAIFNRTERTFMDTV